MKNEITLFFLCFSISTAFSQNYDIHFYEDKGNLRAQNIIAIDDGYVLISRADCYIPGMIAIEGCDYALNVVRIDHNLDTIWKKNISFGSIYNTPMHLLYDLNGTISVWVNDDANFQCNGLITGPFGAWNALTRHTLDAANGEILDELKYPDECQFAMSDVIPIDNSSSYVIGDYHEPNLGPNLPSYNEGRILKIGGTDEFETAYPDLSFGSGQIAKKSINEYYIFHNIDQVLNLTRMDAGANILGSQAYPGVPTVALKEVILTTDGDYLLLAAKNYAYEYDTSVLIKVNAVGEMQWQQELIHRNISAMVEASNGDIFICHETNNLPANRDVVIRRLSADNGAELASFVLDDGGDETPKKLIIGPNNRLVVLGTKNCCNFPESVGPGKAFVMSIAQNQLTSTEVASIQNQVQLFPNPSTDRIFFSQLDKLPADVQFKIIDAHGQVVKQAPIAPLGIDIHNLPQGMYFYLLEKDQMLLQQGRFIKI